MEASIEIGTGLQLLILVSVFMLLSCTIILGGIYEELKKLNKKNGTT